MYKKEIEILKEAIINEHEGNQFYLLVSEKTEDTEVKEVFISLAAEEQNHEKWLRSALTGLLGKNQMEQAGYQDMDIKSPGIFKLDNLKAAGSLMVSALHIGIMMEKDSMDYYRKAAKKTGIPEVRNLYHKLADWEGQHLEKLEKAYDFAKEEWWSRQGFSPA